MDKNARIIAITRILPGLQTFLAEVLVNESLSADAERQRVEIVKELDQLTKPPVLPPRPSNLKSQSRSSVDSVESTEDDNDFASVQRKLSNIFYLRRDFEEINEHLVNGTVEEGSKTTARKIPVKSVKKKHLGGIYEDLQVKAEIEDLEVLSEEEGPRGNRSLSLARGANIRASLGKGKWFAKKEKPITHDVSVSDLLLPTISGHLMEVRTNKRRWCVLKDQHLYIFKNQEEPAYFVIDLPGCDISTVPKVDKSKMSYSFKITQDGVAAVILGIEEEKDLSAWMNALITASVAKTPLSPQHTITKTLPRGMSAHLEKEDICQDGPPEGRRHTFGSLPGYRAKEVLVEIDLTNYEQPKEVMGMASSLDAENYNPPLPPLPGELNEVLEIEKEHKLGHPHSICSGIYEEVTEEFLQNISEKSKNNENSGIGEDNNILGDVNDNDSTLKMPEEHLTNGNLPKKHRSNSEGATSDSECSSDEDPCVNERLFHDRWAVHSGILYQKRPGGWNRHYCKIIDNSFKCFRYPDDPSPVVELNLSACNVRAAEPEGKRKFIFQLSIAEGESLHFNTDTKESLERWLEVISIAATSRLENSITLSEEELDKPVQNSNEHHNSRDSIPSPVPERVESLRRSRVLAAADVKSDSEKDENSVVETPHTLPRVKMNQQRSNSDSNLQKQPKDKTEDKHTESLNELQTGKKGTENKDVWERRVDHQNYNTAPRAKSKMKNFEPLSVEDSSKSESIQSLDISSKSPTSPQHALHISKKHQYAERLKKYLDKNGQFSGFILELSIKPNSTNLTRRWAVVQNGFLRIYENYGCAAPFLRISLVEAFLKDFTNMEKSRFCFMLEYGMGQSILFQTNTHQELKRWVTVITLSIACHTDLFGSGMDLRRKDRIPGNVCENPTSNGTSEPISTDGPDVASPESNGDVFVSEVTSPRVTNGGVCECDCGDEKVNMSCTPTVLKKVLHHKSHSLISTSSIDSDDVISENSRESFTYRTSLTDMVKHRGYLRVTRGIDPRQFVFCELKGSLFSVYENEKCEKAREVFNLLYDKYEEAANGGIYFTIKNDSDGVVQFECDNKEDFEAWKRVVGSVALQETGGSSGQSSESLLSRKRSSFRASMIEEETKHHDVVRELNAEMKRGDLKCDCSEYKCHVYEVRDSSGNKTIIRRWCVINNGVIQIFERETSREAVTELDPNAYRLKDIENPGDFPFAFQLEPLHVTEKSEGILVIQASNVTDFRELLKRIKSVCKRKLNLSKSESNIQLEKKNSVKRPSPLNHSKSDLSLRKEVKRIFSLARKSSKGDVMADVQPLGHATWPKVTRRERKSSRRAMSDTSTERPVTHSMIESTAGSLENRKSMGYFYDYNGHFTGYLTEVRNNELCRSEVRKWCVVENQQFSAYDDKNTQSPSTVIDLRTTQLVDMSHVYKNSFEFRVNNGVVQSHLYRAASDFQKWIMVLTGASADIGQTKQAQAKPNVKPPPGAKTKETRKDVKPSQVPWRASVVSVDEDTAF